MRDRWWWMFIAVAVVVILCMAFATFAAFAPTTPMPVPTSSPSSTPIPKGDGVLTLGTLFPTTGESAFLARSQHAGVELAVREINEAGGVNGTPVVVFHQDSGDGSSTKAEESLAFLVSKSVDVVIGPSTAIIAEQILPAAISAGMVLLSPSAISPELTSLHHDDTLFRMAPSDALEGKALAGVLGKKRVAVIYYSDDTGQDIREELAAGVEANGGELVASEKFSETINGVNRIVATLTAAKPDAVILASPVGAAEKNQDIILALSKAGLGGAKLWLSSRNLADYSRTLPEGTLDRVNGLLLGASPDAEFQARVTSADPSVSTFGDAAEVYDATILAALAAIVAGDDSGRSVGSELRAVSASGITCTSFGECREVLKTRDDIDYDGVSGPLSFDEHGNPRAASFGVYKYGADNTFTVVDTVVVE